jgi:hypothetical protein
MDTACVDVVYENGSSLSVYTPMIEKSLRTTVYSRSRLDLLIESDPDEYFEMLINGTMQRYLDRVDGIYHGQKIKISNQIRKHQGCSEGTASYLTGEYLMYES